MADETTFKDMGLNQLLKTLKDSKAVLRVGILGNKNARSGSGETNAEIGAKHEFGSDGMPQRSFLRMPLETELAKALANSQAFSEDTLKKVIAEKTLKPWLEQVGFVAEAVIQDAFATGGFGQWPQWSNPNYTNNTGQILVDTQQLRDSISSEVKGA